MTDPMMGLIGIIVLLVFVFFGMPIGFSMIIVGFAGFAILAGTTGALSNLSSVSYLYVADYGFVALPLFLLMGTIAANTGISRDLYKTAHQWIGHLRGGLSMATVVASAAFAAVSGSSAATAAAMGKVALPEMRAFNYDDKLATGSVAAGGTMGILIPPSMGFILYAILTEESIGQLFMAGIIPGILEAVFYIVTIYLICLRSPDLAPAGPKTSFKSKIKSLKGVWSMLVLFVLVMGGIYSGVFTPTEAGAVGASGAVLISLIGRRITRKNFFDSLGETGRSTAMIFLMIIGSMIFTRFLAISNLPFLLANEVSALNTSPTIIIIIIIIFYIIVGCFLDIFASLVLTIPIIFPMVIALGFHPIWFGVLFVRVAEIGLITPPIGMNCFILSGVTDVPTGTIFRGVVPFVIADIFHVALLVAVPELALFLPGMMIH
jgi:C4-dicarboxylate transporter DctM subunit